MDIDTDIEGMEDAEEGPESSAINPGQIERSVKEQMDERQVKDLDLVLKEGNELLFGKDSHYQLMDGIKNSQDIPGDLGNGAFSILMMLYKGGGYTMPTDIMDAAGVILLSRASAFLNQSGLATVTDDNFEEAVHIFTVKLHSTLDPSFNERMSKSMGQPQQDQMQQEQPQPSGILNQGV